MNARQITQRQIEAAVKAIAAVWESHGAGYLSPGLFEEMARVALEAAAAARSTSRRTSGGLRVVK